MNAELRKLIALPTPRWTLVAATGAVVIVALVAALAGPGDGRDLLPVKLGVGYTTWIAATVLGAWMIGLEYGQKTVRRALTADPRRLRLLLSKLAVVLGAVAAMTIVLFAGAAPLFSAIASAHGQSMPASETLQFGLATLFTNLVYATAGFALALATRSMAGGMALALGFAFVISTALSTIPSVGAYALSTAVLEIMAGIAGGELFGIDDPNIARALAVTAAWLTVLIGVSITRFTRSDVD
jgi:ABC-type transport system involved in multi-copper enzyme maturation permease subunit